MRLSQSRLLVVDVLVRPPSENGKNLDTPKLRNRNVTAADFVECYHAGCFLEKYNMCCLEGPTWF